MNKEEIIETIPNGFRTTIKFDKEQIKKNNNNLLSQVDKVNELIITKEEELQIKELLNRIDKAIELLEVKQFREINENDYVLDGDDLEDIKEILKGDSKED